MPCLLVKTNQTLSPENKTTIATSLSAKVSEILAKPETYVMTVVEDQTTMTMSGTSDPCAYLELKSINLPEDTTSNISKALCQQINEQLSIESNRIYIEFSNAQRHLWGWDERTF